MSAASSTSLGGAQPSSPKKKVCNLGVEVTSPPPKKQRLDLRFVRIHKVTGRMQEMRKINQWAQVTTQYWIEGVVGIGNTHWQP